MAGTYTINLVNCAFFARHGVFAEEEALGQRFFVDAQFEVRPSGPLESDSIDSTLHYGDAFQVIEEIVTGRRYFLIEALAIDVAKTLVEKFSHVEKVRITLRKPSAPIKGVLDYVEVSVEHCRGD